MDVNLNIQIHTDTVTFLRNEDLEFWIGVLFSFLTLRQLTQLNLAAEMIKLHGESGESIFTRQQWISIP